MLLTENNEIKLSDFYTAKIMEKTHASTYVGTRMYISPEVFRAQFENVKYYPNTDIW